MAGIANPSSADIVMADVGTDRAHESQHAGHTFPSIASPRSAGASQSSSFNGSASSPDNAHSVSKDTLQSSPEQPPRSGSSPPSSLPAPASHGQPGQSAVPLFASSAIEGPKALPRIHTAELPSPSAADRVDATTAGLKRTANGRAKSPASATSTSLSPGSAVSRGHSRQTSASSSIGEISAQLRTRLAYATFKVQRGWETRSLAELEGRLTSPRPAASTSPPTASPHAHAPPPATSPSRGFYQSSERTTLAPDSSVPAPRLPHASYPGPAYAPSLRPQASQHDPAYPAPARAAHGANAPQPAPALAPPVDFAARPPAHPRRSHPGAPRAPLAPMAGGAPPHRRPNPRAAGVIPATPPPLSQHSSSGGGSAHLTPSAGGVGGARKASAAMEQDAIETLVFMSSPGNSQRRPGTAGTGPGAGLSPRRTNAGLGAAAGALAARPGFLAGVSLESGADIERALDRMPVGESSSSSEDEEMGTAEGLGVRMGAEGRGVAFAR